MGFLPLGIDGPARQSVAVMVYLIIAINALVFLHQVSSGEPFTNGYSMVPYNITHDDPRFGVQHLVVGGHQADIRLYPGPHPIFLTLLTSMFMHGSPMHIIGNMLYLFVFGRQIEDLLGKLRFVIFYLLCGLAASAAQIIADPDSIIPNLGASGAIAGVLGAFLVKYPTRSVLVEVEARIAYLPAVLVLGGWFALQVFEQLGSRFAGAQGGVAYMAHIGGFITGVVLVFLFSGLRTTPPEAAAAPDGQPYDRYR
jgi:membrane associated rhomboid family serine protease